MIKDAGILCFCGSCKGNQVSKWRAGYCFFVCVGLASCRLVMWFFAIFCFFIESRLSRRPFLSCMLVVLINVLRSIQTLKMENSFGMS